MPKITAIIPTKNEARNIAAAIDSVRWADEILVLDSFSSDETAVLAQQKGVTVLQRAFDSFGKNKNFAIAQAAHPWVFILDADERVTPELQAEIQHLLQTEPPKAAYWIYRQTYFMDKLVRYSGWQNDKVIRLFRKELRYHEVNVHEEIAAPASETGALKNKLLHYTYTTVAQYLEKWDRYTTLSAQDRAAKTKAVTLYHLALKPTVRFLRHYVIKLGFLDGKVGFIISYMAAVSVFMRYLKLWRFQVENKTDKP